MAMGDVQEAVELFFHKAAAVKVRLSSFPALFKFRRKERFFIKRETLITY